MRTLETLQADLSEAILARELPEALAGSRLAIYRVLVEGTLESCMRSILPRTLARLGDELFFEHARAFYAERGPQTHYLRDVPSEMLAFVGPRWRHDPRVPAYALDLARHEAALIEISAAEDGGDHPSPSGELELGKPACFARAARVVRYEHAVHRLPDGVDDRTVPEACAVALLGYRDREHELRWLELSPAAAEILERMMTPGTTVQQAIIEGAAAAGAAVDEALLSGTSVLLADLADRGVLLGSS